MSMAECHFKLYYIGLQCDLASQYHSGAILLNSINKFSIIYLVF